ncbi:type II secretion system F family protein [Streptomyces sp. MST-110588]|nr:type II secretion system F family protein [Streptomyces sp. MST-110588]
MGGGNDSVRGTRRARWLFGDGAFGRPEGPAGVSGPQRPWWTPGRSTGRRRRRGALTGRPDSLKGPYAMWWRHRRYGIRGSAAGDTARVPAPPGPFGWWRRHRRFGREVWCLPAGIGVGLLGRSVLPVLAAVAAMFLVGRRLRTLERARERERRRAEVIRLCDAVAGELHAGRQPGQALLTAGTRAFGDTGPAVQAAARFGGDIPKALRAAARSPGAGGLTAVAACWQVAAEGGAGLASGLERIAAALRSQRDQREDLRAQLAGPRATALMLALLPLGGLLMGTALGADPLRVLLHTPAGWGCLAVGLLLEWGGLIWTARIVSGVANPAADGAGSGEGVSAR